MFLLARNCCGLAHCPGAKSTCFSIILVFSHVYTVSSRLQCNTADLPSGYWVPTCWGGVVSGWRLQPASRYHTVITIPWISEKTIGMALNLEWLIHAFFWSWRWWWLPLHWLWLGFQIICTYPSFITSNYRIQQIWLILNALWKIQTQFLVMFFLFVWLHFWNHFCTNLSHVQFLP